MVEDHHAQTRVISTLVELEFMQQSQDLQDEIDRQQIRLYALNDTQFTLDDLQFKATGRTFKERLEAKRIQSMVS